MPPAYLEQLGQLHSDVPAEPFTTVRHTIEEELGRPLQEVFASIDETPLAAASVAQVHLARLTTGEAVAVKVQRSDARAQTRADLDIIVRLGARLQRRTAWARRLGIAALADGFAKSLDEELDYRVEVGNMAALAQTSRAGVEVPGIWPELSSRRLIVMERIEGVPLSRAGAELAQLDDATRQQLVTVLFEAVLRQLLHGGVFHADLHPGNIVLSQATPNGSGQDTVRLVMLDFGSVGRLDRAKREALAMLLLAFNREDAVGAIDALTELLGRPKTLDDRRLEGELGELLLRSMGSTDLFTSLARVLTRHGFTVPNSVAAAFRTMSTLEGSLRAIDPSFELVDAARRSGPALMAHMLAPAELRTQAESQLAAAVPLLRRMPRRLERISDALESGRLTVGVRPISDLFDRAFVGSLVRQLVNTVLCSVLAACGAAMMLNNGGSRVAGDVHLLGYLGGVLFLFGFVLGARLLVSGFLEEARESRS